MTKERQEFEQAKSEYLACGESSPQRETLFERLIRATQRYEAAIQLARETRRLYGTR
jgi:hypothetical protein